MSTRKEDDEEEDKNSTPSWVLVILGIVLFLGIVIAVMYYLGKSNEAPQEQPRPQLVRSPSQDMRELQGLINRQRKEHDGPLQIKLKGALNKQNKTAKKFIRVKEGMDKIYDY